MKRHFLCMAMSLVTVFGMCACSNSQTSSSSTILSSELTADMLSIDDFDWSVDQILYQGTRCYALSLTNNSKYDLLGVEIDYRLKDDATEAEIALFDDFKAKHSDYIDEDDQLILRGYEEKLVESQSSISEIGLAIGAGNLTWYDEPSEQQFSVMQPDYLLLGVIYNNKLYAAYYDLVNESWSIGESTDINDWPTNELTGLIPKPECKAYTTIYYENIQTFDSTLYGITKEFFDDYVQQIKDAGFTNEDYSADSYYIASDADGNSISLSYNDGNNSMYISLNGTSE